MGGEFDRVAEQVQQHLQDPASIGPENEPVRAGEDLEAMVLGRREGPDDACRFLAERGHLAGRQVERDTRGLDLGDVEDVVDQEEQVRSILLDLPERPLLAGVQNAEGAVQKEF